MATRFFHHAFFAATSNLASTNSNSHRIIHRLPRYFVILVNYSIMIPQSHRSKSLHRKYLSQSTPCTPGELFTTEALHPGELSDPLLSHDNLQRAKPAGKGVVVYHHVESGVSE
jgi:hypothetical protein